MAKLKKELKDILEKYGIDPTDKSKLWDCHGTLVLYHKAYEVIAAKENIIFDPPQIIETNAKDKMCVVLVVGRMGERSEWSFGEAAPYNSKNSYPFAMAEKRAKDRVIGKLVGLAQYVYSEDEADEFKAAEPKSEPQKPKEKTPEDKMAAASAFATKAETDILSFGNTDDLTSWLNKNKASMDRLKSYPALIGGLNKAINAQYNKLQPMAAE